MSSVFFIMKNTATPPPASTSPASANSHVLDVLICNDGRVDAATATRSACRSDDDNIGVGCRASRIVGLDLDVKDDRDGLVVLAALAERLGETVPETLTVATPSGGRHLYFAAPDGCTIGSFSGDRSPLGPGVDVRGPGLRTGGYLVGPGSVVGGIEYVIVRDVPVLPLPDWIAARLA